MELRESGPAHEATGQGRSRWVPGARGPGRARPEIGAHARGQGVGEAEDGPPGSVELSAGSAGGSRCTGQVSTPGSRPPRWVRGRRGRGGPPGRRAGLGGEARGGRAEPVSVAVSPWTRLSRKPEKRVCLSAAREDLGVSLFLFLSKPSPPEMPEQLYDFTEAGSSGSAPALN